MALYSNSKKKTGRDPPQILQRKGSGDFDDFNTISKQSRKLKYRKLKDQSNHSVSRSISRKQKRRKKLKMDDFYDKLSEEFEDQRSDNSMSKGHSGRKQNFQSHWGLQSKM